MKAEWTKAVARSVSDVALTFGFDLCEVEGDVAGMPDGLGGAIVPLVGERMSIQLGVMAEAEGQLALTRVVLQMDEGEEADFDCVSDALGELANCVVGKLKVALRSEDPTLRIGLPMFIEGTVEQVGRATYRTLHVRMNETPVSIALVVAAT